MERFSVTDEVERFPPPGGWFYIIVPDDVADELSVYEKRGFIPVTVTYETTTWETSLLPMGDGRHFLALNAKVRKAHDIDVGDRVTVELEPRER